MPLPPTRLPLGLPYLYLRLLRRLILLLLLHRPYRLMFRPRCLSPPSLTLTLLHPVLYLRLTLFPSPSTPPEHPFLTYAVVIVGTSTPPPLTPDSAYTARSARLGRANHEPTSVALANIRYI